MHRFYRKVFIKFFIAFLCSGPLSAFENHLSVGGGGVFLPLHGSIVSFGVDTGLDGEVEVYGALAQADRNDVRIDVRYYGFRYKYFVNNSLFLSPGVGQKIVRGRMTDESLGFVSQRNLDSYGAEFIIGNLWKNDRLRFGMDWIGYFHPIMSTATQSSVRYLGNNRSFSLNGNTAFLAQVAERTEKEWNSSVWSRLTESGNWIILRMHLGYFF